MGFIFYDVETTGLDTRFDQIVQFAAIHTDSELNEIARIDRRCRLLPHIVPSPKALHVTRTSIGRLTDPALPSHYEMIADLAATLASWGSAIYIGWNNIGFDEHMLRQALYQCLHSPYLTNTEGNGRCDAIKVAQVVHLLEPGTIVVPVDHRGKTVFKLDQIAPANGFDHRNAHDAMADVEATLHICRLIYERAPARWSDALRFVNRAAPIAFMEESPAFLITECYFGNPYQYALTLIAVEDDAPSVIAYDLAVDPAELRSLDDIALARRLARRVKPVRRVKVNTAPLLYDIYDTPGLYGMSPDALVARAEEIRADRTLCARLVAAVEREPPEPSVHVEERIYEDFSSDDDKARMRAFHLTENWRDKAVVGRSFADDRLVELARRLVFLHSPETLAAHERDAIERALAARMLGHGFEPAPWFTLPAADAEAIVLLTQCSDEERERLLSVQQYIADETARCTAIITAG